MRLLICGDREWKDRKAIDAIIAQFEPDIVIEGEARGADKLARFAAEAAGIPVERYPADWTQHGKAAGPIRNTQMLREGKPDAVVGLHDRIDESKGTRHMLTIAKKTGVPTYLYANGQLNHY